MKRVLGMAGTFLSLAGIAILVFVAVAYVRSRQAHSASTPHWSSTELQQGQQLARQLVHQRVVTNAPRAVAAIPPGREPAVRIVIPAIRVNAPVIDTPPMEGEWEVADWAVGHLTTTPNPGAKGNMALSAHDDIKGEVFKRLGELKPGDQVLLYTRHSVFSYVVVSESVVDPSDISVLAPTKTASVTLISCTPYWVDTQRVVVRADLKSRAAA